MSFIKSATSIKDAPNTIYPEIAFLGRSNVGKSSLINALAKSKLAKSSSTPGKTRLINFFEVKLDGKEIIFVDLPGFGYAKVSKEEKRLWEENLTNFIKKRESINIFLHLIDSRHPELDIDESVKDFIGSILRPHQHYVQVYTKIDKLNQKEFNKVKDNLCVSTTKSSGLKELIMTINSIADIYR